MKRIFLLALSLCASLHAEEPLSLLSVCLFDGRFDGTTGMEKHVIEHYKNITKKGIDCSLVVKNKSSLHKKCMQESVPVIPLSTNYNCRGGRKVEFSRQLSDILTEKQFDLVHCNCFDEVSMLEKTRTSVPLIFTNHFNKFIFGKPVRPLDAIVHINQTNIEKNKNDDIIARVISPLTNTQEHLARSVSQQAFFKEKFNWDLPDNAFVLVMVGNMYTSHPFKDYELVSKGAKSLCDKTPLYLVFVGDGPRMSKIKKTVTALNLNNRILLTGFYKEVDKLLAYCDAFILASKDEGFGLSTLEAAQHELPLLLSKGMMLGDFFGAHNACLQFDHTEASVKDALEQLIASRDLQKTLGKAAKEVYQNYFSPEAVVDQYIDLYAQVIAARLAEQHTEPSDQASDQLSDENYLSQEHLEADEAELERG